MGMPRASTTSRVQHVDYASFLAHIHSSGRLAVGREFGLSTDGLVAALQQLDEIVRIDGPSDLPELDLDAAVWGVARLHAACVLLAHRDHGVEVIEQQMLAACPSAWSAPATHYSVDLSLRHLPDVWRLARGMAPADPLLAALRGLGARWPLSSVGLPQLGDVDSQPVLANAGLRRMYVDRILRREDKERAQDPAVAAAVEAGLGEHREFARSVLAVHDELTRPGSSRG
jgi:hypothetical protein